MTLEDITSENDLREWLTEYIPYCEGRLQLEWVEPSIYGSSVGTPDCKIKSRWSKYTIGVELKYLLKTRKGVKWSIRPAQRRYHHMHAREGGRSALLAYIPAERRLVLVRGNNIPLRDYASDPASGIKEHNAHFDWGINTHKVREDENAMYMMERYLFNDDNFWET